MPGADAIPAPRGRGAEANPPNRFREIRLDPETPDLGVHSDEEAPDLSGPPTRFFRDTSRTVLSWNDSPDVGFEVSVNPYRGCDRGCAYCVDGDTEVLMADGSTRPIASVRAGDVVYGTERHDGCRRLVRTTVVDHWTTWKEAWRVRLADGMDLIASADHRFLSYRGWSFVAGGPGRRSLRPGDRLVVAPDSTGARRRLGGGVVCATDARVRRVESLGSVLPMYDVTTGTGDFIANGVVSHNCYARPTHEYLGLSAGLDFESMIFVKEEAPALLRKELLSPRWTPRVIAMSGVTDPYQSAERRFRITRGCLEVLAEFRNPVGIVTKSALVTRDVDLLAELAAHGAAQVYLSITTLDRGLQRVLEPRASPPAARLAAIETLTRAGVPCGVIVAPVIPGLTDHEMPEVLAAARRAGATSAGYTVLRLPYAVKEVFERWLERHRPDRKDKVLHRVRAMRAGALNDPRFGSRMEGEGVFAEQIRALFEAGRRKAGLLDDEQALSTDAFRRPAPTSGQLDLFPQ